MLYRGVLRWNPWLDTGGRGAQRPHGVQGLGDLESEGCWELPGAADARLAPRAGVVAGLGQLDGSLRLALRPLNAWVTAWARAASGTVGEPPSPGAPALLRLGRRQLRCLGPRAHEGDLGWSSWLLAQPQLVGYLGHEPENGRSAPHAPLSLFLCLSGRWKGSVNAKLGLGRDWLGSAAAVGTETLLVTGPRGAPEPPRSRSCPELGALWSGGRLCSCRGPWGHAQPVSE